MWHLLTDFLLFSFGAIFGVVLMCLMQAGKEADNRTEKVNDWRNDK